MVLCATVLVAVPLAGVGASVPAGTSGAAVTNFPLASFPSDITAGPEGALWFTDFGTSAKPERSIGRITPAGVVTTFASPAIGSPGGITAGPDGALWFTNQNGNKFSIGRMTTSGTVTTYTDRSLAGPGSITAGPDGALWFTNDGTFDNGRPTADTGSIGRITTSGTITNYRDPSIDSPGSITTGPDGALWFINEFGSSGGGKGSIGRITTTGAVTHYSDPSIDFPGAITAGPDGALWFTNTSDGSPSTPFSIGRITTTGTVTNYTDASIFRPGDITAGPDGALWFTNSESIGRITTAGTVTSLGYPLSPSGITAGPDGALWFTNEVNSDGGSIGRITTSLTATAPGTPTAVPDVGRAVVQWTAPDNDGSSPTTGYEVTPFLGDAAQTPQVFDTTATTETVTGLTNGKTYQFKVAAENANGTGAFSDFTYPIEIGPPSPWKIIPSPNPTGRYNDAVLNAVACTSATHCLAVGTGDATGQNQPLIERWDGTTWSIAKSAPLYPYGATLNAVSCKTVTSCFAVGYAAGKTLIERWNDKSFVIDAPSILGSLFGVACATPTKCFAVGGTFGVILTWNGTTWTIGGSHKGEYFNAVTCTGPTNCLAVGRTVKQWNGTKWTIIAQPNRGDFFDGSATALSCTSATNCYAVGTSLDLAQQEQTSVVHWNGTTWTPVASPNPTDFSGGSLNGVSCTSATNCVAVGANGSGSTDGFTTFGGTLIERWNGTNWTIISSPNPTGLGTLNSVSCPTTTSCVAVGAGSDQTLVEQS